MLNESFVKFVRGTPQAFERLKNKNPDTLYLIREKDARTGSLYLGDTLIASGYGLESITTDSINDFDIDTDTLNDGDILVYDYANKKWINQSQEETVKLDVKFEAGKNLKVDRNGATYTFSHNDILTSIIVPEEVQEDGQLVISNLEVDNGHIKKIVYSYVAKPQPIIPQSKMEWGTF